MLIVNIVITLNKISVYIRVLTMNKTLLSLLTFVALLLGSCGFLRFPSNQSRESTQAIASYTDWDRAVRADVDMQNMFVGTPQKIEKPIDMYMAMALALKYNYSRRMISYEQSVLDAGKSAANRIPEVLNKAGYTNSSNSQDLNPDLKVTWNILDMSTIYFQCQDNKYKANVAFEQSRKVIHNVLQETRALYWKTLTAQRLLPVIDNMIEYMTLEVDVIKSNENTLAENGQQLSTDELIRKRKYMDEVLKLSTLKREMQSAETMLASFMGLHPSTEYNLVGNEYNNFDLPELKSNISQLEWLALINRPELRVHDLNIDSDSHKIVVKGFSDVDQDTYRNDPNYYNRLWSRRGREFGLSVLEDASNPNPENLNIIRRQRMTSLIISQVYVSWAYVMSAVEDYQINQEIANTSENIAEDTTIRDGSRATNAHLEASRAIEDEVKASLAYVDVQEALGNLYATVGLDALPYFMLDEKPSRIAVYLRTVLEKWRKGEFLPDNRPYLMNVPSRRPPVNLSSPTKVPDIKVETGERIEVEIPQSVIQKMDLKGKVITKAGLADDRPLPKWMNYDPETHKITGTAMPGDTGDYKVKVYIADESGSVGYVTFDVKIKESYIPSMRVDGLTSGRKATVLKKCIGTRCGDNYINSETLGKEVETRSF